MHSTASYLKEVLELTASNTRTHSRVVCILCESSGPHRATRVLEFAMISFNNEIISKLHCNIGYNTAAERRYSISWKLMNSHKLYVVERRKATRNRQ